MIFLIITLWVGAMAFAMTLPEFQKARAGLVITVIALFIVLASQGTWGYVSMALTALVLAYDSYFMVETYDQALVTQFGKITDRRVGAGMRYKWPIIEGFTTRTVDDREIQTKQDKVDPKLEVVSSDSVNITLGITIEFWPDRGNLGVFARMSNPVLEEGLKKSLEQEMTNIVQLKTHKEVRKKMRALHLLANCILRTQIPPHFLAIKEGNKWFFAMEEDDDGEFSIPNDVDPIEVPLKARLDFYENNSKKILRYLKTESDKSGNRSDVELRYGIDIKIANFGAPQFTGDIVDAMEQEERAKYKMKAVNQLKKIDKQVRGIYPDLTDQESKNVALSFLDKADIKVHSVEGVSGANALIGINTGAEKGSGGNDG